MKTRFYILLLSTIFSCYLSFSQNENEKQWQILPYLGLSTTQGDYTDLSDNGIVLGLSVDKYLSSKFALGFDLNYQTNDFINPFDYSSIPNTFGVLSNENNKWSATTLSFGPSYKIGSKKISAELFLKGGLSMLKVPEQSTTISGGGVQHHNILELKEENISSFGFTSGIRLNYAISDKLSFFVNPQYVFSGAEFAFFHRDITTEGLANPDLLVQDGGQLCYVKPSYLHVNAGIKFNLGGSSSSSKNKNKKADFNDGSDLQKVCSAAELLLPLNGKTFYYSYKERPKFEWTQKNSDLKEYIFRIYDENKKILFQKNTSKNSISHSKELETVYSRKINDDSKLIWNIESVYSNCKNTTSETQSFRVSRAADGFNANISNLQCDLPAYDVNGNINITGQIELDVSANNSSPVRIDFPMDLVDANTPPPGTVVATLTAADMIPCGISPVLTSPFIVNQGAAGKITFCFKKSIPIGVTNLRVVANGFSIVGNNPLSNSSNTEMPDCACNDCKKWEYNDTEHTLLKFNSQGHPFNFQIAQELQIIGVDPIMEVKAEIISVQHVANDPQCYTCTKHENKMGLFSFGTIQPREIYSTSEWTFNGHGQIGKDVNGDDYSNQIVWRAKDPTVGVDFSTKKRFIMPISLPDPSSLDCCEHKYKVCVRYTFTDINCITCSSDGICYLSDGKSKPIVIGNPSGGIGTTKPNVKLKKI